MSAFDPFVWLLVGGVLRLFDFGRKTIPIAAWLSPIFLLHFAHWADPLPGMLLIWLALFLSAYLAYREVIPVPGVGYPLTIAVISLFSTAPYLADRLLSAKLPGFTAALVFPIAWVVMELVTARTSPFGSWGSVAYTQYGDYPLMQLASVTGLWGISFLVAWFGSTINWAWEQQFSLAALSQGVLPYALIWGIVMLAGGARLAFSRGTRTVRVAAIGWPEDLMERDAFMRALAPQPLSEKARADLRNAFRKIQDYFLDEGGREAKAGARIIAWPEANLMVFKSDEAEFVQRAAQLAAREHICLLMGVAAIIEGRPPRLENKAVLVGPSGEIAYSYFKQKPVPGWEAQISIRSTGQIPTHDSAYGRLASAVCFDMDFPQLIRQAGRSGVDLLVVPASDWEAITHLHHAMAAFRAVENGAALLRATRWGTSAAVDAYGRTLATTDSFSAGQAATVAQVQVKRVTTAYARMGDWFAWICVVGLAGIAGWVLAAAL
jgi:apolipoprotein N-acyltransferase